MNVQTIPSTAFSVALKVIEESLQRIIDAIRCTVAQKKMEEISTLQNQGLLISRHLPMYSHKFNVLCAKIF
jgi:hypothetical protein